MNLSNEIRQYFFGNLSVARIKVYLLRKITITKPVTKLKTYLLDNLPMVLIIGVQVMLVGIVGYYSYTGQIVSGNGQSISGNMFSIIFVLCLINAIFYGMIAEAKRYDGYIEPKRQNRTSHYNNSYNNNSNLFYNDQRQDSETTTSYSKKWDEKREKTKNGGLTNIEVLERKKPLGKKLINNMKIRNGYVSNSSSSSFMIPRQFVSDDQLGKIYNHMQHGKIHDGYYNFGSLDAYDSWGISDDENYVSGNVSMDNFDMYTYLTKFLGIEAGAIKWDD